MGRMWSSWRLAVPGRTLCLKQEPYHKQTITSPVISNPATHVHSLIMSIKSPPTPPHAHTHTQTRKPKRDRAGWLRSSGMHAGPAPEGSEVHWMQTHTDRAQSAHTRTSSSVNIISPFSIHPFEAGQSLFYQPAVSVSVLFSKREMLSSPGETQLL